MFNHTLSINISGCLFVDNHAEDKGGAISYRVNTLSLNTTLFKNNTARVTVSNTEFTSNTAGFKGGALSAQLLSFFNLVQCVFKRNSCSWFGGALYSRNTSTINILRCLFTENHAAVGGGAIHSIEDKLIVSDTEFISNNGLFAGGAIDTMSLNIIDSSFRRNKAGFGAAIFGRRSLNIKNVTFDHNVAESRNRIDGHGGAIFISSSLKVKIFESLFKDNMAKTAGGSISHTFQGSLSIKRTIFQINSYSSRYRRSRSLILDSSVNLVLEDVAFQNLDKHNTRNSLIEHVSKRQGFKINHINVTCSTGKDILATVPMNGESFGAKSSVFFTVSCSSCSSYTYSLSAGKIGPNLTNQSHINCYKCPFGGNCTNGRIKAASNFWGYIPKMSTDQIHFSACPFGYGCSGSSCNHYDSCGTGRKGVLCGQCKKGLTENIVTHDCLSFQQCRHPWFWLVILMGGIIYVLLFLFLKEIANLFVTVSVPKRFRESSDKSIFGRIKDSLKNLLIQNPQSQLRMDDTCCEHSEADYAYLELLDITEYTAEGMNYNQSHTAVFPGMFKIVLFFHQSSVLFKVFSTTKSYGFTHIIQEVIATLFNLRIDGIFFQDISWCPFENLQPVSKVLFKASFILYLFAIIFFVFFIFKLFTLIRGKNNHQSFYSHMCCCVLQLLLISYSSLTVTCFSLLSCVNLDSIGQVLFIDGSIRCYTWWQFIIITIVCIWIASLPIAIYAASWLLNVHMVSAKKFLLSLLLPLPTIIYWLHVCIKKRNNNEPEAEMQDKKRPNKIAEEMQDLLEGPFRCYHGAVNDRQYRLSWESIFIGRRLILIIIMTFVTDTLLRLYLMLFFMFLFTLHHIYVRPFISDFLNSIELISLCMLSIICALNILPAYMYMNPMTTSVYIQSLANIFCKIETILTLLFPSVIGFIVAILVTVRVLQFLLWMFCLFVRLIHYCCERKISWIISDTLIRLYLMLFCILFLFS